MTTTYVVEVKSWCQIFLFKTYIYVSLSQVYQLFIHLQLVNNYILTFLLFYEQVWS